MPSIVDKLRSLTRRFAHSLSDVSISSENSCLVLTLASLLLIHPNKGVARAIDCSGVSSARHLALTCTKRWGKIETSKAHPAERNRAVATGSCRAVATVAARS